VYFLIELTGQTSRKENTPLCDDSNCGGQFRDAAGIPDTNMGYPAWKCAGVSFLNFA
jgi:hypothetical protein